MTPRLCGTNYCEFQWTVNGTAISGATASKFTFGPVSPVDSGAQVVCQIHAIGLVVNGHAVWSNSVPATVTVTGNQVFEPGIALHEYWGINPGLAIVEAGARGSAQLDDVLDRLRTRHQLH